MLHRALPPSEAICLDSLVIIGSGKGLPPVRRQTLTWMEKICLAVSEIYVW